MAVHAPGIKGESVGAVLKPKHIEAEDTVDVYQTVKGEREVLATGASDSAP